MKNGNITLDPEILKAGLRKVLRRLYGYRIFIFFLVVAAVYGFILWRINTYSNTPANAAKENAQIGTQPHIDQTIVQKMLALQDNSVNVQALFDQARQNPFQE